MTDKTQDTFQHQTSSNSESRAPQKRTRGTPTDVDKHVGKRLKIRRNLMGMSQDDLAQEIGVTFQQIQKYEHGTNRISAGKLYEFADIMNVGIGFFFEGLDQLFSPEHTGKADHVSDQAQQGFTKKDESYLEQKETLDLIRAYYAISDEKVRTRLLQFIRSIADSPKSDDVMF